MLHYKSEYLLFDKDLDAWENISESCEARHMCANNISMRITLDNILTFLSYIS